MAGHPGCPPRNCSQKVHPSTRRSRVPSLLFLETCKTGCLQVLGNELKPEESKLIYGLTKSRNGKCLLAHA